MQCRSQIIPTIHSKISSNGYSNIGVIRRKDALYGTLWIGFLGISNNGGPYTGMSTVDTAGLELMSGGRTVMSLKRHMFINAKSAPFILTTVYLQLIKEREKKQRQAK